MPPEPKERDLSESEAIESAQGAEDFEESDAARFRTVSLRVKTRLRDIKYCIVTVLPEELDALRRVFDECVELRSDIHPVTYFRASVPCFDKPEFKHQIVIASVFSIGNCASAIAATSALKDFNSIRDILVVGIAGGIPAPNELDGDVRLGDVVVSAKKGLVQYDMVKLEENAKPFIRSTMPLPSPHLSTQVALLEADKLAKRPWETHIDRVTGSDVAYARPNDDTDPYHSQWKPESQHKARRKGYPFIHLGIIGSANVLLKSPTVRDNLKSELQIIAVEMDGSGVAEATWLFKRGYLIVRGISDYCDADKAKTEIWRRYAGVVAASYARALLERIPPGKR